MTESFDIWSAAFPSEPLPSLLKRSPCGQLWPHPWGGAGHKLEHMKEEGKLKKSYSLKLEGLELWYLVCSIS